MSNETKPAKDPRVAAAVSHWGHRFVANGIALADFEDVTGSIDTWDQWCAAWSARGAVHEVLGREAMAQGHMLSAGEHLQRAGAYYHFGKFLFVHDIPQMKAAHDKAIACRNDALLHLSPPGERVEIPFEGGKLFGILRKPARMDRPPVVLMACGLDSCKEETGEYEAPFLARGIATLVFDGPGQGEAEYDLPIRGNYETATSAVIDYAERRSDIDASRLGMWGVSLGGYYSSRSAAHDKRIKACVALSGPYDWGEAWDRLPGLTREAFRVRSHSKSEDEARKVAATLTLKDCAKNITCPIFIVTGKLDTVVPWQDAECLAREVQGPCTLLTVEDGNHVVNNRGYRWRTQTADWMAGVLGG